MSGTSTSFNKSRSPDGFCNIVGWIANKAERSPEHPLFAYGSENCVSWAQTGRAIGRAAWLVDSCFGLSEHAQRGGGTSPLTVGILANFDSITYHILYLGILRAGGIAFLISTENSPTGVAYLLEQTGTRRLIVSADKQMQELATSRSIVERDVTVHTAPTFEMLFDESDAEDYTLPGGLVANVDSPAIILHSSGSTAFPKIVILTHRTILQWAYLTNISGVDMTKQRLAVHALPVYHTMGLFVFFWAACSGLTLAVFSPQTPPVVPSPAILLTSAVESQSTFIMTAPLFLEIWSRDTEAITQLKKFRSVVYGGGPLKKTVGDALVRLGVQIGSLYGTTELGAVTLVVLREPGDNEWAWLHISPRTNPVFIPQGNDTFEIVYVECATHIPLVLNTTVYGKRAFATNDIVVRHPTDGLKFIIVGRMDSQSILSSGEKTNTGPIEAIMCGNPLVHTALMFWRGRDQRGILIQPAYGHEFDPADTDRLAQFRNDIWQSVEEANAFAPSYSRLHKEMILVTHPSRPIEMTAKHTPRRTATLEAYKDEIDSAYTAVQMSVHNDADIFEQGGDVLQATSIRNTLVHASRQIRKGAAERISQSFVYANPTISRLANSLLTVVTTPHESWAGDDRYSNRTVREMEALISEFSANFPTHRPSITQRQVEGEVVLLTGSTGALGSQLLALLVSFPEVCHVYALNRRAKDGSKSLRQRQVNAFRERGLDVRVVDSPKVTLVEGDTAAEDLNIDPVLFSKIRDRTSLIIHNAWKVSFNLALGSFKLNIRGVRTLVNLALKSPRQTPPRIVYASSVGVFRNWDARQGRPPEARIDDPKLVLRSGYSESKFVGECILENAANATPLRPVIVRIGQLTGTASGAWNSSDWVPAIVRSGQVLGVLPARSDCIAWISLETAAHAMFEFRHSESQYLHLAHPNPARWSTIFEVFSSLLNVPLVSWTEWLSKLEKCDRGMSAKNPAVYLIDFFRGCAPVALENREAPGTPLMDMQQALKESPSLAHPSLPQIGRKDAERWVRSWKSRGFLSNDAGKL